MLGVATKNSVRHTCKSGFTLIELSIVLVIIGLIIGGTLVGQDLIFAAKVRSQQNQIIEIETQINTFKLKENCLPGDCANATTLFGTTDAAGNTVYDGNGDGIIKGTGNGAGAGECLNPHIEGEVSELFMHLSIAGFGDYTKGNILTVGHIGTNYPYAKFGNGTGVFVSCLASTFHPTITPLFLRRGNIIVSGATGSSSGDGGYIGWSTGYGNNGSGNSYFSTFSPMGIPAEAARRIDEKIDDGKPSSGKFGILTGALPACDNAHLSEVGIPLLTAYPSPLTTCSVTVGKRID